MSALYPEHRSLLERSLGSLASFPVVRSRVALLARAHLLGIAVPATQRISGKEELLAYAYASDGPFFLKRDGTWGGGGVHHVSDPAEALTSYRALTAEAPLRFKCKQRLRHGDRTAFVSSTGDAEISAQRAVHGVAANAMFACHKGRVVCSVQVRVVGSKGKTGPALMVELIDDPRIAEAGSLLASSLELTGFFGLDFILEESTGIPYLIEMNPRATQLGHIAVAGQPDLAGALWTAWTGDTSPRDGDSALGARISFFPQALEWAADSPFVHASRFDVCLEDLEVVKGLAAAPPSPAIRLMRLLRAPLLSALAYVRPPAPAEPMEVYYFSEQHAREAAAATVARQQSESLAASLPGKRSELVQLRLSAPLLSPS